MGKKAKVLEQKVIALLRAMDNSGADLWLPDMSDSIGCYVTYPQHIKYESEDGVNANENNHDTQGFSEELELLQRELRGDWVEVFINGDWDTSFEHGQQVVVWDKGTVVMLREKEITEYLDNLDYDCYLIPTEFEHPDWDGLIDYRLTDFEQEVRGLEFRTEYEYFSYVIESKVNGQNQQVRNLYATLKKYGKDEAFKSYVKDIYGEPATLLEILEIVA